MNHQSSNRERPTAITLRIDLIHHITPYVPWHYIEESRECFRPSMPESY